MEDSTNISGNPLKDIGFVLLRRTDYLISSAIVVIEVLKILVKEFFKVPIRVIVNKNKNCLKHRIRDSFYDSLFQVAVNVSGIFLYRRFKFFAEHPRQTQLFLLQQILSKNKNTVFGKKHGFSEIKTLEDFRSRVPIQSYDNLENYVEAHTSGKLNILTAESPITFATTSGTTGKPKFIPITKESQKHSHQNISRLWAYSLFRESPATMDGKILAIASPAVEGFTESGIPYGSASGQLLRGMNSIVQKKYVLPHSLMEIQDYDSKYYCILLLGFLERDVRVVSSANPSTLQLIAAKGNELKEKILHDIQHGTLNSELKLNKKERQDIEKRIYADPSRALELKAAIEKDPEQKLRPKDVWRNLHVIACWTGGNAGTFLRNIHQWYGNEILIRDLGYLASELRGSIPLSSQTNAGVLTISENFFEFIDVEDFDNGNLDQCLLVDEIEVGKKYYLIFTNRAGLYRYNINDIIEVTGYYHGTPTIIFLQKGKGVTNITGEKIYEQQLMKAVADAELKTGIELRFYQAQARLKEARYELFAEFDGENVPFESKVAFISAVEEAMQAINIEYKSKRKSLRLAPFQLHVLDRNSLETFKQWRISHGIREAQFKTIPLTDDYSLTSPLKVLESISIKDKN